jgi:hypothetical protein
VAPCCCHQDRRTPARPGGTVEPAGQRRSDCAADRHRPDAGVTLGPILVAPAEAAGVIADVDDLDASTVQIDAAGAKAEQLAAA